MPLTYASVAPGTVADRRPVPSTIARPEYVDRPAPGAVHRLGGQGRRDDREDAGRLPDRGAGHGRPPPRSSRPASRPTRSTGSATSSCSTTAPTPRPWATRAFPKSLCTSVNEVICHGIPDSRRLEDGDIVNIDITGYIGGVHGDTDATYLVGDVDEESRLLVERTHEAMMRGIRAALPGRQINVIGRVIESYARRFGYGVVRDFTGHGIGTAFHSGLVDPPLRRGPGYATVIEPGMTFTIEPMLNLGTPEWDMWDDGWTVVTKDRRRSAQFEHTILITDAGNEILTLP